MDINIVLAGAAGLGINTINEIITKNFHNRGKYIFSTKNYMSRVRGGFNFTQIRISDTPFDCHSEEIKILMAFDKNGLSLKNRLSNDGILITSNKYNCDFERTVFLDEIEIKKTCGKWTFPMAILGVFYKIIGFSEKVSEEIRYKNWSQEVMDSNIRAIKKGYSYFESNELMILNEKNNFEIKNWNKILVNGNQGIALGAAAAGVSFYFAYPMAPSTGVMNYLMKYRKDMKIIVEQAEDEIAAINGAIGASSNGIRAMTGSSGGGLSLMVEGIGFSAIGEVPLVIVNVQRPGPATGLPTRTEQGDLNFMIYASQGEFARMIIAPRNIEDSFYETFRAFNMADKYNMPVIILTDEYLADSTKSVELFNTENLEIERYFKTKNNEEYKRYDLNNVTGQRAYPGMDDNILVLTDSHIHDEMGHITEDKDYTVKFKEKLMKKLEILSNEVNEPEYYGVDEPEILLIGWGSTYGGIKETIDYFKSEFKIGGLLFCDVFPLPKKNLIKYSSKAKFIINIEQNYMNQFGKLIILETGIRYDKSINKYDGRQMNSEYIKAKMEVILNEYIR